MPSIKPTGIEPTGGLRFDGALATERLFNPRSRLSALAIEHDDLDAAILALLSDSMFDDLLISRLKKRKLQIKDEIAALLSVAGPETVAQAS